MKVQLAKIIYVKLIAFLSLLVRNLPTKKRLVYLMSFKKNDNGFLRQFIEDNPSIEVVILYEKNCNDEAEFYNNIGIKIILMENTLSYLANAIYLMSQAKVIVCDNYFPIFAGLKLKEKVTVIQLWHANGAIKCFGLEDRSIVNRSNADKKRFEKVYNSFDEYIVGSKMMGKVFEKSYNASNSQIVNIGFPRSDVYFNKESIESKRNYFYAKYPELENKKIILYAPTYRDNRFEKYPLDIETLYKHFGDEYVLLFRRHPHTKSTIENPSYDYFYYDELDDFKLEDLLIVTDCLITDYSSVPFDYSLLNNAKKIIFFCYDYEKYKELPGIQTDFSEWAPGSIVKTMEEVVQSIKNKKDTDFTVFNEKWNTYNDGRATERLVQYIRKKF